MPGGNGFAMNAFGHLLGGVVVTIAASLGQTREVQRRFRGTGWQDSVPIVAIAARGSVLLAAGQGQSMNAGAVTFGLLLMAPGAVWGLGRQIIVRVL